MDEDTVRTAREVASHSTGTPESWDVFAMVKRGGGFNRDGALDWEYFLLRLTPDRWAEAMVPTPGICEIRP